MDIGIWNVIIAVLFGGLGGLTHDVIQNKRFLQKPGKDAQGNIFLGFWAGLLLGGISGLLVGLVLGASESWQIAAYTGLTAGIALKGLAEAAGTQQPPQQPQ